MIKPLTPKETDLFNKYHAVSSEYMEFGLGRTFNRYTELVDGVEIVRRIEQPLLFGNYGLEEL